MDRGTWWMAVHGVAKCQTRLSDQAHSTSVGFIRIKLHNRHTVLGPCLTQIQLSAIWKLHLPCISYTILIWLHHNFLCVCLSFRLWCAQPFSVVSDSFWPHGPQPARLLCPWDSPGKNTGVGCYALLQGSFPTQGSNPCLLHLLHCRPNSLPLSHWGNPKIFFRLLPPKGKEQYHFIFVALRPTVWNIHVLFNEQANTLPQVRLSA